jgi:hypothetical protein
MPVCLFLRLPFFQCVSIKVVLCLKQERVLKVTKNKNRSKCFPTPFLSGKSGIRGGGELLAFNGSAIIDVI